MGSSTEHSRLRPDRQPVGPRPGPGRQQRRVGGGRGRLPRPAVDRHGHRRLDPPAGRPDRHRRHEADVRPGQPLRHRRLRLVARPDRAVRPRRPRRRGAAPRDRRSRRARLDVRRRSRCRTRCSHLPASDDEAAGGAARQAPRPAARVLRGRHGARRRGARPRGRRGARGAPAPSSRRSACRTPTTASRPTTSSPRPRRRPTSPATTASATARGSATARRPRRLPGDPRRGLRGGGQAPDHARHVRAVGRLLRRLLPQGPEGPDADQGRLRCALGAGLRCPRRADLADRRVPVRRADGRPGVDVPLGRLHAAGQHGRACPGISIPCGLSEGLPVGLQFIGAAWSEAALLGLARGYEAITADADWRGARADGPAPPSTTPPTRQPSARRRHDRPRRPGRRSPSASSPSASWPCRRPGSAGSSTSPRRWTTSSASGWGSPTSTRRGSSSRPASRACARAGPTTRATTGRSSCGARSATTSSDRYGVRYDPATEILVTVGASEALDLALRATCDPGDEVILHEPSYVAYVPAIVFAGGVVRHVATRFEDDFALDPAAVEAAITPRTKALFLGYPSQPDRRGPARRRPGRARRDRRAPRPARLQRRDLRPPGLRRRTGTARSAPCRGCASGRS